jgi:site-specific recombinase XerD
MLAATQLALSVPAFFTPTPAAGERFVDFFTSNIRNRNTRRAYRHAVAEFAAFCESRGVGSLREVRPIHVAAYVEQLALSHSKPTAKLHLAAVRMLFDWLVTGQVIDSNPAHAVRGPRHSVKKGKTPVLTA